jgi:hypothetical protein
MLPSMKFQNGAQIQDGRQNIFSFKTFIFENIFIPIMTLHSAAPNTIMELIKCDCKKDVTVMHVVANNSN